MSKFLYPLYYRARRVVNYILFHTLYRIQYPDMMKFEWMYKCLSYTGAAIKFGRAELGRAILSESEILNEKSLVIDVGGETGLWSEKISEKFNPELYIFEPNPESVKILNEKFPGRKTRVFPYGLGSKNIKMQLSDNGMGSSVFNSSPDFENQKKFDIEIRDIADVIKELSIDTIDMIKINIEGGEFELLPRMIEAGITEKCRCIRIQFHDWIPDSFAMRSRIVRELSKTHNVEWSYPLVWESWIRKDIVRN